MVMAMAEDVASEWQPLAITSVDGIQLEAAVHPAVGEPRGTVVLAHGISPLRGGGKDVAQFVTDRVDLAVSKVCVGQVASHPDYAHVKPRTQIAAEIRAFLSQQPEPEIWAFYPPFDTILCQLFGPMSELPAEIPAFTRDLMQEAQRQNAVLPAQHRPVHHALSDARHDLRIAAALGLVEITPVIARPTAGIHAYS